MLCTCLGRPKRGGFLVIGRFSVLRRPCLFIEAPAALGELAVTQEERR